MSKKANIAIIGSGISSLVCANILKEQFNISIFEKSRGVSGRTSTRYVNEFLFNHGTPYFTAQSQDFIIFTEQLIDKNIIKQWNPQCINAPLNSDKQLNYYIGNPKMNDIAKYLSHELDIKLMTEINKITYHADGKISLSDKTGQIFNGFDKVIITAPSIQTENLLDNTISFKEKIKNSKMHGCYSLMIGTYQDIAFSDSVFFINKKSSIFSHIVIHSKKNQDNNQTYHQIVAYAHTDWSEQHIDDDMTQAQNYLLEQFPNEINLTHTADNFMTTHRWRYAHAVSGVGESFLYDNNFQTGVCGDWCYDKHAHDYGGVERAFISGKALGDFIKNL
jgi:predicted NAD/FAD-dependent oxidoreductase